MNRNKMLSTANMTRIAVLGAISAILFMWPEITIIPPFYKLDFSTLPVLLGGFAMGVGPGVLIVAIKDLIGLTHSGTAGVGELADFIMTCAMLIPAVMVYQRKKSRKGALISLAIGSAAMIVVAALVNAFLLFPMLTKEMPSFEFILTATLPFNLLKAVVISAITYFVYKPLSPMLKVRK
ncbi:MAG: ECF transporter S component [Clostridia bacterium]|nr:ECF transporter S component [Clostridia bacterium]